MMWNYLASGLLVDAAVVLYDGSPADPDLGRCGAWRARGGHLLRHQRPVPDGLPQGGLAPGEIADLSGLRGLGSTGAPLPAEGFRYVYESVSPSVHLQSVSGGTDVCTAFVGASPLVPVWEGEISCRHLGCAVEAFSPDGRPLIGEQGELVITRPMPSMPVAFWNDPDGSRYRDAYFAEFPGVWRHGDWITFTERGSCVITGRSDATLNRGGVRVGTAELYAVVEALPEVADSVVIHLDEGDQLILFVALRPEAVLDQALEDRIRAALRTSLSPRHVPDRIVAVPGVPRTLSNKKLEVPIKRILTGTPPEVAASRGSLANPESLDAFVDFAGSGEILSPWQRSAPPDVSSSRGGGSRRREISSITLGADAAISPTASAGQVDAAGTRRRHAAARSGGAMAGGRGKGRSLGSPAGDQA